MINLYFFPSHTGCGAEKINDDGDISANFTWQTNTGFIDLLSILLVENNRFFVAKN